MTGAATEERRIGAVVPAAGRGSRLGLGVPKILVEVADGVTVWHRLRRELLTAVDRIHVVLSPDGIAAFRRLAADDIAHGLVTTSIQPNPNGMGDAIFGARSWWDDLDGIVVVWGDQVGLNARTVSHVVRSLRAAPDARLAVPLVPQPDPYVEYVFDVDGMLAGIRQSREGDRCRPGGLSDVGVFGLTVPGLTAAWTDFLLGAQPGAGTGEINFLPFLVHLSREARRRLVVVPVDDPAEARGLNTPADLDVARAVGW